MIWKKQLDIRSKQFRPWRNEQIFVEMSQHAATHQIFVACPEIKSLSDAPITFADTKPKDVSEVLWTIASEKQSAGLEGHTPKLLSVIPPIICDPLTCLDHWQKEFPDISSGWRDSYPQNTECYNVWRLRLIAYIPKVFEKMPKVQLTNHTEKHRKSSDQQSVSKPFVWNGIFENY